MFTRKQKADKEGYYWCDVHLDDLEAGEMMKVKINGRAIVLSKYKDQIYAFDDTCPHGAASLVQGSLFTHKISCPDHGYCFDIRTGAIVWPEDELYRLHRYAVKVDNGRIKLLLSDT